jgi:hypothetical protein
MSYVSSFREIYQSMQICGDFEEPDSSVRIQSFLGTQKIGNDNCKHDGGIGVNFPTLRSRKNCRKFGDIFRQGGL